ncbi:MAG: alpha/beta hydrolase [Campylobacterota bacterium]|nr:alpha/beta hydrolase [Campylobacterota bacterium]
MALKKVDYFGKNFNISYEIVNSDKKETIVFLHGWGSNKEIMKQAFGKDLKEFKHIYIDMPGFGKSDNNYTLTTIDYANIMKIFLESIKVVPNDAVIAGHSFGGKVATTLMPKTLVLLSSAGIVEEKPLKVKLKIALAKFFNSLGLKNITKVFRSKDVENMDHNMYETFKNVVDEDFSEYFKGFYKQALIFWGKEDTATSLSSGKLINDLIKNSVFKAYEGDHYFFIKNSKDICDIIQINIK